MTIHESQQQLNTRLYDLYDDREAAAITDLVMEHITGWKKIDRIIHKNVLITAAQVALLKQYTTALLTHEPVQYVLHGAWFYGMKLYVDKHVLIPRPETEELVELIIQETKSNAQNPISNVQDPGHKVQGTRALSILDVGTGSGCIAIALKKELPLAEVYACDVSTDALAVAQRNASSYGADIHLRELDFLNPEQWSALPFCHIIVSNPPYIPLQDKAAMRANVVDFEPHLALFVQDNEPLIFYMAIANFAKEKLLPGGSVFVELHEDLADSAAELFRHHGFTAIEIKKDLQGKARLLKATWLL